MQFSNDNYPDVTSRRLEEAQLSESLDEKYGYNKIKLPCERLGWLINMCSVFLFF